MLLALLSPAAAATLTVEADGSGDYTSISAAITAAASGDEIRVGVGTWRESLTTGSKAVTITGVGGAERVILDATGHLSAVVTQGALTISDMTIQNTGGRGLAASVNAQVTVSGVTFEDVGSSDASGGAVEVSGGSVTLSETIIDGGEASYGMIYVTNGASLSLVDSTIKQSTADYGAGIFLYSGSVIIEGSTLEQLYSAYNGGAVYLSPGTTLSATDTTFYANLTESGHGSAIYADSARIETTDSTFELNYATNYTDGYTGGAVYLTGGQLSATRTIFTENLAYSGGAIHLTGDGTLTLVDSELSDNWAYYGGALQADYVAAVSDRGSEWAGNESYYAGAAIYAYSGYTMDFEGSSFIENYARYSHGGAVYGYYGNSSYTNVTFEGNWTYYGGGAVYAYYTYGTTAFDGCTFEDNTAQYYGGAVYSYAYDNLQVTDSTFSYNEAEYSYGGAIYSYYSNATILRSTFTANRALASMGGAVYSYHYYSDAPDLIIEDSSFDSNEAAYHGGAVASLYNRYEIRRSRFHVNDTDSAGMGGAVFTQDTLAGLVSENRFSGNNAGYGGAVYSYDAFSTPSRWSNNTFAENTANIGGAMVVSGSDVTAVVNNTFVGNTSVEAGGTLVLVESGVEFVNNAVTHSTAGEGVYIYDEHSVDGSEFAYNAFYEIADGIGGGLIAGGYPTRKGLTDVDPRYTSYSPDGDASNDSFVLLRDSGLIDAGDPGRLDPDGSVSDIGAWGGSELLIEDADGDGYDSWLDCDDDDPSAHPGATETWYDGTNSDCLSGSDFDADGDGADADAHGGTDCDDADASVQTDCGGSDTTPDTGTPEEEAPTPPESTGNGDKGCSATGGTAGLLWLAGLLGLSRRSRR